MNHVKCLISTIICSAKVLKILECIKWIVIFSTFGIAVLCARKMLKDKKVKSLIKIN